MMPLPFADALTRDIVAGKPGAPVVLGIVIAVRVGAYVLGTRNKRGH
jgi:hypothetical protein